MMGAVLRKPKRPLPRQFNRPVTPLTRSFVSRRHKRIGQYKSERRRRWLRRAQSWIAAQAVSLKQWLPLAGAGLLVLLIALALFSPLFQVREIRIIRGEGRIDVQQVLKALAPLYGKHLLFVTQKDVETRVRAAVSDVAQATVSKRYPSQLSIRIVLRPLIARLRIEQPGALAGTGSSVAISAPGSLQPIQQFDYLTDTGIYVTSPATLQDVALPTIRVVDWGVHPLPGTQLLPPDFLERLQNAEQVLTREFGLQVKNRTVYSRAREFHLQTPTFALWFDVRTSLQDQVQRFRTFLKTVKLQDIKEYVDLRLVGRVVYK